MSKASIQNILNKLIDKQFKKKLYEKTFKRGLKKKKKIYPCITVSRETGSGGRLVAALAAKQLKIKLYDKELVELIAKNAKKRQDVIESLDDRSRGMVEGIITSLTASKSKMSESRYIKYLYQTVLSLTQKNKAVILGRGANFIIPPKRCLSIRIIAPLKVRIENTVKFEKKSLEKAREHVKKKHFARKDFVRRYFLKNISNANYYDLVINTQFITLNQAASLLIKAFKDKFSEKK
jgi:cytidylate kinase